MLYPSLCAWALEELQDCEEFEDWSRMVLEPWYETQLVQPQHDRLPESSSDHVDGCEVRLVYKALHALPHVGGSYVISLFEDKGAEGGLIVRAFDRAKRSAFWLSLSRGKVASFGGHANRSPAALAVALTRRLKMKPDGAGSAQRLVLPPVKKVESSYDRKAKSKAASAGPATNTERDSSAGRPGGAAAGAEAGTAEAGARDIDGEPPDSSDSPASGGTMTATPECPAERRSQIRRSHPPPTRGSAAGDLSPLAESEVDGSESSAGDLRDTQSVLGAAGASEVAAADDERFVSPPVRTPIDAFSGYLCSSILKPGPTHRFV